MVKETAPYDIALEHLAKNEFLRTEMLSEAMHSAVDLSPRDRCKSKHKTTSPCNRCLKLLLGYANSRFMNGEPNPLRVTYHYFATIILRRSGEREESFRSCWKDALDFFQEGGRFKKSPLIERI